MTAELHLTPSRATSSNGLNLDGAKWFFYQSGTTTPQSVYTTSALNVAHTNPVVADAAGKFAPIYFNASLQYRGVLKSADEATTIYDIDPINTGVFSNLAASGGSALVGFLQEGTGAVARTAQDKMRDIVHVKDFGAVGNYSADDTTAIQAAIDACPAGGSVIFDHGWLDGVGGDYRVTAPINITRHVNLIGNKSRIVGDGFGATGDIIVVSPASEIRNWKMTGLTVQFASGGRDAVKIGNGSVGFLHAIIENCTIVGGEAGYGLNFVGVGTHFSTVRNCFIVGGGFAESAGRPTTGGIRLACADEMQIYDNLFAGRGCGIHCELISGAYKTQIIRNGIVSRDVGIFVSAGQQIDIFSNQFEQGTGNPTTDANQATYKAHIVLYGSGTPATGEEVRDTIIKRNNFGGGSNQSYAIVAVANCQDNIIDENVFGPSGTSGGDIYLLASTVRWTRVGSRNRVYGIRGGVLTRGAANTVDPKTLLSVSDSGTGTYGFAARKAPTLAANYTGSTNFCVWKDHDDNIHFEGSIVIGAAATVAGGTVVFTLPDGMRPAEVTLIPMRNNVNTALTWLQVNTDGAVTCENNVNVSSTLFISSAPNLTVRGRTSYLSGPY